MPVRVFAHFVVVFVCMISVRSLVQCQSVFLCPGTHDLKVHFYWLPCLRVGCLVYVFYLKCLADGQIIGMLAKSAGHVYGSSAPPPPLGRRVPPTIQNVISSFVFLFK